MQWSDANRLPVNRFCWVGKLVASFVYLLYSGCCPVKAVLLSSEPNRHSFRIKPDTRADSEGWDSILLGEFVNDDRGDSQEGGKLPGIQSAPKSFDSIGQGERLPFGPCL